MSQEPFNFDAEKDKMHQSIYSFYYIEEDAGKPPEKPAYLAAWLIGEGWSKNEV